MTVPDQQWNLDSYLFAILGGNIKRKDIPATDVPAGAMTAFKAYLSDMNVQFDSTDATYQSIGFSLNYYPPVILYYVSFSNEDATEFDGECLIDDTKVVAHREMAFD